MIRRATAVLLICAATAAQSQTLQVRSGEHGDFTRLVIGIAPGTEWELRAGSDAFGRVIHFPGKSYSYDTSTLFDRIGTDRIAGLRPDAQTGDLGLQLSCACEVKAFVLANMLVLDITDPDPEARLAQAEKSPGAAPARFDAMRDLGFPDPLGGRSLGVLPLERIDPRNTRSEASADSAPQDRIESLDLSGIESDIAEQLAQAATRGILDVSETLGARPETLETSASTHDDPQDEGFVTINAQPLRTQGEAPHSTVKDGRILLSGDTCIRDEYLALEDWADGRPFETQLRELRRGLVGEFDQSDSGVAARLARFYLHFGMGPEARTLLSLSDVPHRDVLEALADVLGEGEDTAETFSGQTHCDGPAALWSLLSLQDHRDDREINADAVLRGFDTLPEPLQPYLAKRLVDQLMAHKQRAAAEALLKRIGRLEPEPSEEVELARAEIEALDGNVAAAAERLKQVARSAPGAVSAQAVEKLLEMSVGQDEPVGEDISDLAAAYSVELRGTEDGPALWRANLRGMIGSGNFVAAFDTLDYESSGDPRIDSDFRKEAADAMIARASDVDFLRIVLSKSRRNPIGNEPATLFAAAERLLALGLPDAAARLIDEQPEDRSNRKARLLRARIHLAMGQPEDAEIALIGLQGQDVLDVRAAAREMMGDVDYADPVKIVASTSGDPVPEPEPSPRPDGVADGAPARDRNPACDTGDHAKAEHRPLPGACRRQRKHAGIAARVAGVDTDRRRRLIPPNEK